MKNKKVLITGAGGFIGSHLTERLMEVAAGVRAFIHYNSLNQRGHLDQLPPRKIKGLEMVAGDVRDYHSVYSAMKNVDIVFHLAALIGIPYSYEAPGSYVETNIYGTLNVLQAARNLGPERVLVTSTSEVYGTAQYVPIDERHPLQGQSPYSATKIGADRLAESFYRSFDLPVTIVRPFNTYGPRQSMRAVIPAMIMQALTGRRKIKLGNLTPTRDFVYVQDTVEGFIRIAGSDQTVGEEINIATQKETSIKSVLKEVSRLTGKKLSAMTDPVRFRPDKSEVERQLGSNEKIARLTGWSPQFSLTQGLEQTIRWLKKSEQYRKLGKGEYVRWSEIFRQDPIDPWKGFPG